MYDRLRHGSATPVFVDTSALVGLFHGRDQHASDTRAFVSGVRDGSLRARPIYTSEYVIDELATVLLSRADHGVASQAVTSLRDSTLVQTLHVDRSVYELASDRFLAFDDQAFSFTDHVIGVQAQNRGVDIIISFDQEFATLGLQTLPE